MSGLISKLARRTSLFLVFTALFSDPARTQEVQEPPVPFRPPSLEVANVPEIPDRIISGLKKYHKIGSSVFLDWSPNSRSVLVSSQIDEMAQLQFVSRAQKEPLQLTYSPDPIENGMFRPGSADILFSRDIEGTEKFDLFLINSRASEIIPVTAGGRNISPVFSRDGMWLAWSHADDDSADFSIVLAPVSDTAQQRILYMGKGYWVPSDFSPDGTSLALRNHKSRGDADVHVLDLESGSVRQIDLDPEARGRSAAVFSNDGKSVV